LFEHVVQLLFVKSTALYKMHISLALKGLRTSGGGVCSNEHCLLCY